MEKPYSDIAARLRVILEAHGISNAEFARTLGLKPTATNNWLTGASRISIDGALLVRERYGAPLDFTYCGGSVDTLPKTIRAAWLSRSRVNHSK